MNDKLQRLKERMYDISHRAYIAFKETLKDKDAWKDWVYGLSIYLGPWIAIEKSLGGDARLTIHELEEVINYGYTVPAYFPLSSPLKRFIENYKGSPLTYKQEYGLEMLSVVMWKTIQYLGRNGLIPLIPPGLWEGETTSYPSFFDVVEVFLKMHLSETPRDLIRAFSFGSLFYYLRRKFTPKKIDKNKKEMEESQDFM